MRKVTWNLTFGSREKRVVVLILDHKKVGSLMSGSCEKKVENLIYGSWEKRVEIMCCISNWI